MTEFYKTISSLFHINYYTTWAALSLISWSINAHILYKHHTQHFILYLVLHILCNVTNYFLLMVEKISL